MRKLCVTVFICLLAGSIGSALAQDSEVLAYVSGGSTGKIYSIDSSGPTEIFSAKKGFRPAGMDTDGNGRIFICDTSKSEIHILEEVSPGSWELTTIHARDNAASPTPEQPVGCRIVGADLLFGERSGSGEFHGIWKIPGAAETPTSGPFAAPELLVSIPATSGEDFSDVAFAPDASVLVTLGNTILKASPPDYGSFTTFISGLAGEASAVTQNSVGETFVAIADLGIVEVFDHTGASCGIYVDVSPLRPTSVAFDSSDNLYFAAPRQSNGRNGNVFVAAPHGGAATRQCGQVPPTVTANPLAPVAPPAAVAVSLPPSSVSQDLNFLNADPLTAKQCSAIFTLDPEFLNEFADPNCLVTVTCRMMPIEEFEFRTDASFADTACMFIPAAEGNCTEIVVDGAECLGGITELEWLFFIVEDIDENDCPGLLYAHDTGPTQPYTEDILTAFDAVVPDLPNDPGLKAQKLDFGSGLVGVTGAPNRPPVADAGEDQSFECGSTATVTIDGSGSYDFDPIDADQLTYSWTGPGAVDDVTFEMALADLEEGDTIYTLTVTDTGACPGTGPLSDTDSVTITVEGDGEPPAIHSITASPNSLWPPDHEMIPVTLTVDATDDCAPVSCEITGVTSTDPTGAPDDPDSGNGANTYPDWLFSGLTLDLRAERSEGGDSVDDTRVYTISVECTAGDETVGDTVTVSVVSDQGN